MEKSCISENGPTTEIVNNLFFDEIRWETWLRPLRKAAAKDGKKKRAKKKRGGDDDDDDDDSFINDDSEEEEDISGDEESEADWVPSDDSD